MVSKCALNRGVSSSDRVWMDPPHGLVCEVARCGRAEGRPKVLPHHRVQRLASSAGDGLNWAVKRGGSSLVLWFTAPLSRIPKMRLGELGVDFATTGRTGIGFEEYDYAASIVS